MKIRILSFFFIIPVLLAACASGRQELYQDLMTEFQEAAQPDYYRTEVAKANPQPD